FAGTIESIKVKVGDKVSEGDLIALVEEAAASTEKAEDKSGAKNEDKTKPEADEPKTEKPDKTAQSEKQPASLQQPTQTVTEDSQAFEAAKAQADMACDVLVLGAGPGGYTAAFRAADLGRDVVLVERYETL